MKLLSPDNRYRRLRTLHQFNKLLHTVLWSPSGFALIDPHQCGWLDGGCWTLAVGLKRWLQDVEVHCVYDYNDQPQHVLIRIPDRDIFIDGHGVSSGSFITKMMIKDEFIPPPVSLQPFREEYMVETDNGIQLWKDTAAAIVTYLDSVFGEGPRFLWCLCCAEDNLKR